MWYLHGLNDTYTYLTKDEFTVGRKNKDIIIEDDDSISRNHGVFKIKDNNLYYIDQGSKYGTYLGEDVLEKLDPNKEYKLSANNVITFGLLQKNQSKFKIKKMDSMFAVLSNINDPDARQHQYSVLEKLKIKYNKSIWEKTCTHIIVSEIKLTCKILCAITVGQHIVNITFFPDLLKAITTNTKLPKEKEYKPDFKESLLNKNLNLDYNPERKTLFKDLIFVFVNETLKAATEKAIYMSGGKVISWEKQQISTKKLKENMDQYIFIENSLEIENSSQTPPEINKSFQEAINFLQLKGRRSIPHQEIALAIVHCSVKENCNPLFNRIDLLLREDTQVKQESIFAYDTEQYIRMQASENIPEIQSVAESSISTQEGSLKRKIIDLTDDDEQESKKRKDQATISSFFPSKVSKPQNIFADQKEQNSESEQDINDNPFGRKRKASIELEPEPKKRPLKNISNQTMKKKISNDSVHKIIEKTNKTGDKKITSFIGSTGWLTKEIKTEEIEIKEEDIDREIERFHDSFKNCVVIVPCPIPPRKPKNVSLNDSGRKNFKTFKKVHTKFQHEIFSNLSVVTIGSENTRTSVNEENDNLSDSDEDLQITSYQSNNSRQRKPTPRRKYHIS